MNFLDLNSSSQTANKSAASPFDLSFIEWLDDEHEECVGVESMESMGQFFKCLYYFLSKSILTSCILVCFSICTAIFNIIVIVSINRLKQNKTVFDKIFIGHSIVDALVGILVVPNYCIYSVFGYWPLGKLFCHFYVSLDYTICHVGILHMVFIAYARLRSLLAPKQYQNELLISNAKLTMLFLWLVSGVLWLPAVNLIINLTYKPRECYFNFAPVYIIAQDTVAYLLPMCVIIGITAYILNVLHHANKRRRLMGRRKRVRRKNVHTYSSTTNFTSMSLNSAQKPRNNRASPLLRESENISASDLSFTSDNNNNNNNNNTNNTSNSQTNHEETLRLYSMPAIGSSFNKEQQINNLNVYFSSDSLSTHSNNKSNRNVSIQIIEENKETDELNSFKPINSASKQTLRFNSEPTNSFSRSNGLSEIVNRRNNFNDDEDNSNKNDSNNKLQKNSLCLMPKTIKLNAFAKLYVIIATFCVLWLPFCILWPINSVCEKCISPFIYEFSYWMGYAQSLINPILLLILNPNYNKLKSDT